MRNKVRNISGIILGDKPSEEKCNNNCLYLSKDWNSCSVSWVGWKVCV